MAAYIALVIEEQNDARRSLRQQRVFRTRRTLDTIADHHLERYYRLPRPAVQRLCDALAPALRRPTARSHSLPVDAQVLLALRFYASGSFQSVVGDVANMSQTSASRIINTVSGALCELAKSRIKFPLTSRAALLTARVLESDDEEEEEDDRPTTARDTATGTAVRNELVNSVFK
ncbi:hypothetical protein HPB47_016365 [Ixodes persulcatus]|uniref:Uncharacterized protein n=1 Tax=Ixodes persulcatus TaxID=34615 RepID=A0AC60QTI2_IXOPE|nr:hypothetical protein HPB47_016365 [Ixodes persulcatus]